MDKIQKALRKLTPEERNAVKEALVALRAGDLKSLDLKKLQGRDDIYRIRRGTIRILFQRNRQGVISILAIERRSDTTYHL